MNPPDRGQRRVVGKSGGLNLRKFSQSRSECIGDVEPIGPIVGGPPGRICDLEGQHVRGVVALVNAGERQEAAHEQASTDQQNHGEGDLPHNQHTSTPQMPAQALFGRH